MRRPQLVENQYTLSLFLATLTRRVRHNPFVCHSYRKSPGWGAPLSKQARFSRLRVLVHRSPSSSAPRTTHYLLLTVHYFLSFDIVLNSFLSRAKYGARARSIRFLFKEFRKKSTHSCYPLCFHTVPNSFASAQNLSHAFSSKSGLFVQNTRGVGVCAVQKIRGAAPAFFSGCRALRLSKADDTQAVNRALQSNGKSTGLKTRHYAPYAT
jgi:hypothetical protein